MTKQFFTIVALFAASQLFAQAPINDECSAAIPIVVNGGPVSANNSNTLVNGPNPNCGGGTLIEDIWYSFVYEGGYLTISTILGTNNDTRIALYGSCGGALIACNDDTPGQGYLSTLNFNCTQLTIGNTYYLQAGGYNGIDGNFSIAITSDLDGCTNPNANNYLPCAIVDDGNCLLPVAPVNDECENATPLAIGSTSSLVENTLANTTTVGGICNGIMKDVWYSFVHDGTQLQIDVTPGTLADTYVGLYNGCGDNQIECDDDDGAGNAAMILTDCADLLIGQTYYIRAGGYQANVGSFSVSITSTNSCVLGESCDIPFLATEGENVAPFPNSWFAFVPPANGQYRITTCGWATCDTKLWIYDYCNMNNFDDTNEATITYNDDFCGVQAEMTPLLAGGQTYYLRVGDTEMACSNSEIPFFIEYMGQAEGCMDINACNYTPIAEIPAQCYYFGDEMCEDLGPDLEIIENTVFTSLYSTTINATDACLVNEGCVQGFGTRQILRFTTHIKNIGNQDYFIGTPNVNNPQFEFDQCHNHYHYEGYAEYILFDQDGVPMPQIGLKNGFCVLDLECSGGGVAKYTCGNMGITAGCGDIYGSGLNCQWIDITDVPAGDYYLVVRTNWDQSPDALGHYELRYDNNWAQVCIHFERDELGNIINFTKNIATCPQIVDCLEQPFGNSYPDCAGNCPGMVKRGDLMADGMLEEMDVHMYLEGTLMGDVPVTTCTDLNNDGTITVTDAAMLESCIHGQEEQGISPALMVDCPYDDEIITPFETVTLGIYEVVMTENSLAGYVDISILNPDNEVRGLEFLVGGIAIDSVASLLDMSVWDAHIHVEEGGQHLTMLSHNETWIPKYFVPTPFLRVYFSSWTSMEVCIEEIIDVVNLDNHNTAYVISDCQMMNLNIVDFEATNVDLCEGDLVELSILPTAPLIESYSWEITGTENFTEVSNSWPLNTPGDYTIALIGNTYDLFGELYYTDTTTKELYIHVDERVTWYQDNDLDGYGNALISIEECSPGSGWVLNSDDCDDTDATVFPGATGTQLNIDNDCNGIVEAEEIMPCLGDFDNNGIITVNDLMIIIAQMGCLDNCGAADINEDGYVTTDDMVIFISVFGTTCD